MTFKDYCIIRYRAKMDETYLLRTYNEKTNSCMTLIHPEYTFIIHYVLNTIPCYYWTEKVRKQTIDSLEQLLSSATTNKLTIDSEIMQYFFIAFDTYRQVTEIIQDFSKLNSNPFLKNRLYRIPTYITIVEGCLTNLYRVIASILTQVTGKDYRSQHKLNSLCEMLIANNMGILIEDIDVDIRNAINHGGVLFLCEGRSLQFKYSKKNTMHSKSLTSFEFDSIIDQAYDACSATLLGLTGFFNKHIELVDYNSINTNSYTSFKSLALCLSIKSIFCADINDSSINKEQLNIQIDIEETERTFILQTAIEIAAQVFEKYQDYKKYYVQFNHPRMLMCFVRFLRGEIVEFLNDHTTINDNLLKAIKRGDVQFSTPSTENVDIQEIKYHLYPSFQNDKYSISSLEDVSIGNRKRFRAQLFVGDTTVREDLISIIEEAVESIKSLKNVAQLEVETKHGNMDADSVYLNVFHFDTRKDKTMSPKNENFICFVDYNIDDITSLNNGGIPELIWNKYSHEKHGSMCIAWREKKHSLGERRNTALERSGGMISVFVAVGKNTKTVVEKYYEHKSVSKI